MNVDMMIVGDLHIRNDVPSCRGDEFKQAQARKLAWFKTRWLEEDKPWVLDAGDLLHRWNSNAETLVKALQGLPDRVVTIPGNHDLPYHDLNLIDRSGLSVLQLAGRISVLDGWTEVPPGVFVLGVPYGKIPTVDQLAKAEEMKAAGKRLVLLMHVLVWRSGNPPWPGAEKEGTTAADLMSQYPAFDLLITGHYHKAFRYDDGDRSLVNPGGITRQTITAKDAEPQLWLWNAKANRLWSEPFPIEPVEFYAARATTKAEVDTAGIDEFVTKLQTMKGTDHGFDANLKAYLESNHIGQSVRDLIVAVQEEVLNADVR